MRSRQRRESWMGEWNRNHSAYCHGRCCQGARAPKALVDPSSSRPLPSCPAPSCRLTSHQRHRVDAVQQALLSFTSVPVTDQLVMYNGSRLDPSRTLGSYGLPVVRTACMGGLCSATFSSPAWAGSCNVPALTGMVDDVACCMLVACDLHGSQHVCMVRPGPCHTSLII